MQEVFKTIDGNIFDNKKEALKHEADIQHAFLTQNSLNLSKKQFHDIRNIIKEKGKKTKRFGYPSYEIDENNFIYTSDAGYIDGLVYKGVTFEEFSLDKPLRIIIPGELLQL